MRFKQFSVVTTFRRFLYTNCNYLLSLLLKKKYRYLWRNVVLSFRQCYIYEKAERVPYRTEIVFCPTSQFLTFSDPIYFLISVFYNRLVHFSFPEISAVVTYTLVIGRFTKSPQKMLVTNDDISWYRKRFN